MKITYFGKKFKEDLVYIKLQEDFYENKKKVIIDVMI